MNRIKNWFSSLVVTLPLIFLWLFKREQSKREALEKELEASKNANKAAKETLNAIEVKRDVENINQRDPRNINDRLRDKGYLRNES